MNFWQEKFNIGSISIPRFIGGPLDGITDSPFRNLVREFSREELLYTEMRHVACVAHDIGGAKSLKFDQSERPLNYQVAANSTDYIEAAVEKILLKGVDIVDLNIGCPAKNVVGSGSGSALMADLPRLAAILKLFRKVLPIPFTVKMRAGFKQKNAIEVAKLIQDCGADALAIHPRLQTQFFEGQPDYSIAREVKNAVSIPVIISGGVVNLKTAQLVYNQTGVDGFLIGRGIWARPWKLYEMNEHARGTMWQPTTQTILQYAVKHLDSMLLYYGPRGLFAFRKHLPFYLRGLPNAADIRSRLVRSNEIEEIKYVLTSFGG